MKKANFIIGFKKSIFFVIPFLITSYGRGVPSKADGGFTLKLKDSSELYFKSENVWCKWDKNWTTSKYYMGSNKFKIFTCYANGVRTYLNGARDNHNDLGHCGMIYENLGELDWEKIRPRSHNGIACTAARELGKY